MYLYISQGKEGDCVVEMALREPERFVAKPQREGGGKLVCILSGAHELPTGSEGACKCVYHQLTKPEFNGDHKW